MRNGAIEVIFFDLLVVEFISESYCFKNVLLIIGIRFLSFFAYLLFLELIKSNLLLFNNSNFSSFAIFSKILPFIFSCFLFNELLYSSNTFLLISYLFCLIFSCLKSKNLSLSDFLSIYLLSHFIGLRSFFLKLVVSYFYKLIC